MVRLTVVAGKNQGASTVVSDFPVRIGRAGQDFLRLSDPGVWSGHVTLHCSVEDGFWLETRPEAPVDVDGHTVTQVALRDGSSIALGGAVVQFAFDEAEQRDLTWYGWAIALGLGALMIAEVVLILWI